MSLLRNDASSGLALDAAVAKSPQRAARLDLAHAAPPVRIARAAAVHSVPGRSSAGNIIAQAVPALKILMLAAAIMIADIAYASYAGAPLTLGPARAFWLAGPLAIWGLFRLATGVIGD